MVGVKGLVESGIASVPEGYVRQGVEDVLHSARVELPVVDLSLDRASVVRCVHEACAEWGTFQLVGHGIPLGVMERMNYLAQDFFNLPAAQRRAFYSEDAKKPVRFCSSYKPGSKASAQLWYDYVFHVCNPLFTQDDVPKSVPGYWEVASEYIHRVSALAKQMLGILSEGLGLPRAALEEIMQEPWHTMRINYYPPCPNPSKAVGIDRHTDSGAITLLQADHRVAGLQILRGPAWMTVLPLPGALLVNMGDQMEIISNGAYKSSVHRAVVNSTHPRISIASFLHPNLNTHVRPLTPGPALYKGCKFGDYERAFMDRVFSSKPQLECMKQDEEQPDEHSDHNLIISQ